MDQPIIFYQTDGSAGLSWIANELGDITGVTAGNGITVANPTGPVPTVTVGQGTGITVNTNDVAVDASVAMPKQLMHHGQDHRELH